MQLRVTKTDDELRVLYAEAYAPTVIPDADDDVMTAEEIRAMAYRWMIRGDMGRVDTQHDREKNGSYVVESFIAQDNDPNFIPGAWVVAIHVVSQDLWDQIKAGDFKGLSLDFMFEFEYVEYEIEIPEIVQGVTGEEDGHKHTFYARFNEDGRFIGGYTDTVNGHMHYMIRGTATEETEGHVHVYDYAQILGGDGQVILINEDSTNE
ncbi:XkdF [Vibrio phage 1.215.B._10N.222.54.F7]|nr:XkdF [Vibrio phage 1.215.A._10N.222.54.F7]AUR96092.1 XkdF [Vibrio phage 1.215.B._10N.222.54.F7]